MTTTTRPSTPLQILNAYHRIARFEGLTVKELASRLPQTIPQRLRQFVLTKVAQIVSSDTAAGTNSKRIDPWGEAMQVAALVQSHLNRYLNKPIQKYDNPVYVQELRFGRLEAKRNKILANFSMPSTKHPVLNVLRRLPIRYIDSLRGIRVFYNAATTIEKKHPDLIKDRKLTVLYPASGSHLAPLMTAIRLIDRNKIDSGEFTYTDIDKQHISKIERQLMFLLKNRVITNYTVHSAKIFGNNGTEHRYEFQYKGKKVSIVLALNRSGKSYWRPEYARGADLVILHDTEGKNAELIKQLSKEKSSHRAASPQVILTEGRESASKQVKKPSQSHYIEIQGQYGHCDGFFTTAAPRGGVEFSRCAYTSGLLFENKRK